MTIEYVFSFLGGLGLFIYGMHVLAEGLQKVAGSKLKQLLGVLTTSKLRGIILGAVVTGIIQSSSATTVMVVGFVNANLMTLNQAMGIIMGANIGTTTMSWLVASSEWSNFLQPTTIAPVFICIGAFTLLLAKNNKIKQIGQIVTGFGILFLGMEIMSTSVEPLQDSQFLKEAFIKMGTNPVLGVLAGALVTGVIQSSAASIGVLQSLSAAGLVPMNSAVYIIMGQNIGTCVTAMISSIGTSKNAKSAAYMHLLFNVIGSVIFSFAAFIFFAFVNKEMGMGMITQTEIGIVHSSFNIVNTVVLYNFSDWIIVIAEKLAGKSKLDEPEEVSIAHLDDRILETPTIAIESTFNEIVRLGKMTLKSMRIVNEGFFEKDMKKIDRVFEREKRIDSFEHALTSYLVKISKTSINDAEHEVIAALFRVTNDIERVADHCENIAELACDIQENKYPLSLEASEELNTIFRLSFESFENCINALENKEDDYAREVLRIEEKIDSLEDEFRKNHLERLKTDSCDSDSGVVFLDMLINLERISDHAFNIAQSVLSNKF